MFRGKKDIWSLRNFEEVNLLKLELKTSDFHYHLPEHAIAQEPVEPRDASRLMVLPLDGGELEDRHFYELPSILSRGDLLVLNDTKVLPWKLVGKRKTGGRVECLVLSLEGSEGVGFFRPTRKLKPGDTLEMEDGELRIFLISRRGAGKWIFTIEARGRRDLLDTLNRVGRPPLPPYIKREDADPRTVKDKERYQTVFAEKPGAVAAPTAGLHMTERVLDGLKEKGINIAKVTLHVGPGTFLPVKTERVEDHKMHEEWFSIPSETGMAIERARRERRRVIAVGTTVVRTLESRAREGGLVRPGHGWTGLFIYPGYKFKVIDGMITNFHLPGSTLLMLVCAFAGRERVLAAYRHAVDKGYRFYSYGDAMLIC